MSKIIAIDDNNDNLITLKALLGRFLPDAEILTMTSSAGCVEYAKVEKADLLIIDYIMPGIDGIEACRLLKADGETAHIPVILLTASDTIPAKRALGLEAGADSFLTKPIDEAELAAQVKAMLRIKASEDILRARNLQLEKTLVEKSQTLYRAEKNYKLLFNSIIDIVVIYDLGGVVLEINSRGLDYLGLKEEDVTGHPVVNLFDSWATHEIVTDITDNFSKEGAKTEASVRNAAGETVPVEITSRLIEYNNEYAILSVFHDMAERKNVEELRRQLASLLEDSEDAIIGITPDGMIISWNSSAERIFGYSYNEIKGCRYDVIIPQLCPDDSARLFEKLKLGHKIEQCETTGRTSSGKLVYLVLKISPVCDASGAIIGASIIGRDVTEESRAKEKLKKNRDFVQSLDDINPSFYIAIDRSENILTMNRALLTALGYTAGEVVGKNYIELLFSEANRGIQRKDFNSMLLKKKSTVAEYPIVTRSGSVLLVEWHGRPLLNIDGEIDFIFLVGIDITERKRLEKMLMETNAAERLKIGQDLHDKLAQHLAGTVFKAELLKVKIGDSVQDVDHDIDEIIDMVNMAVSKTREIAKELSPVDISPGGLLAAVENLRDSIKERSGVNILVKWDESVLINGQLEVSNFYYIIKESIFNSIENNEAKNILINASREGAANIIEIRGDGKDYETIDKERNSLFLSLIKYRAWLIGVAIDVRGNPGGGLCISCRFISGGEPPRAEVMKKGRLLKKGREKNRYGVFLIDAHPIVRQGLKLIFEMERDLYIIGEAGTADETLKALGKITPDIITIDICLSGASGIDLIKACRERYPAIPILVLSIYEESLYAERAIRAGARGFVMKNEHPGKIINAIRAVLDGRQYMSDALKEKLLEKLSVSGRDESSVLVDLLTDREFEVFQLIGHGLGNRHIADRLRISVKTVENYREKIKSKLNIDSSPELIQFAVQYIFEKTS